MMNDIEKVAIFLLMIGFKKASGIIGLMDNDEIKNIVPKIDSLVEVPLEKQEQVWTQFVELGYEESMSSPEVLTVIRMLFNGSKIGDKEERRFFHKKGYR
jgi:flagellar motor switch protein FliG